MDAIDHFERESPRKKAARIIQRICLEKMPERTLETQLLHARNIIDRIIERKKLKLEDGPNAIPVQLRAGKQQNNSNVVLKTANIAGNTLSSYWKKVMISEISIVETEPAEGEELSWLLS